MEITMALTQERQFSKYTFTLGDSTFRSPVATLPWVEPMIPGDAVGIDRVGGNYLKPAQEPLQTGSLLKIFVPDMQFKCQIPLESRVVGDYLRAETHGVGPNGKTPVEMDSLAQEMALVESIEFILDASTLRHFMCDPWRARNQCFAVKLVVSRRSHEGKTRRFFTLTKPVLTSALHATHVTRQYLKWAVKAELRLVGLFGD